MGTETTAERTFAFVGGRPCLDFVNTVGDYHDAGRRRDYLSEYADLVTWSRQAGAISEVETATLRREAERRPDEARAVLARAVDLRDAVRRIALATASGHPVEVDALERLNGFVGELLAPSRLVPAATGFVLARPEAPAALDRPLWPVVRSAVALLTAEEVKRVRECAGDSCGWLFLDTSRGGRRRWCDMADCGNVAKARRFRARRAGAAG